MHVEPINYIDRHNCGPKVIMYKILKIGRFQLNLYKQPCFLSVTFVQIGGTHVALAK